MKIGTGRIAAVAIALCFLSTACPEPGIPELERFTRFMNSAGEVYAYDMARDSGGNVVVVGWFWADGLFGQTVESNSGFVAKYDAAGTLLWGKVLDPGEDGDILFERVAVDAAGNVYVSGYVDSDLGGGLNGLQDAVLAKYGPDGTLRWARQYGGQYCYAGGESIAIASDGALFLGFDLYTNHTTMYFGGQSIEGARLAAGLARIDPATGDIEWLRLLGETGSSNKIRYGNAVIGPDGQLYLAGTTTVAFDGQELVGSPCLFLKPYAADGTPGTARFAGIAGSGLSQIDDVVAGPGGVCFAGLTKRGPAGNDALNADYGFVLKMTATGAGDWTRVFGSTDPATWAPVKKTSLARTKDGRVLAATSCDWDLAGSAGKLDLLRAFVLSFDAAAGTSGTTLSWKIDDRNVEVGGMTLDVYGRIYLSGCVADSEWTIVRCFVSTMINR